MKLIEAMKKCQLLQKKAEDLRNHVAKHCVDLDIETPVYGTEQEQREQIRKWIQSHSDVLAEIETLKTSISRTNLATKVKIQLGEKAVEKPITQWILRRRDLSKQEQVIWTKLTDRGLPEKQYLNQTTGQQREIKLRRYYDPKERDQKLDLFQSEPFLIDAALEVVNAVTDLIE